MSKSVKKQEEQVESDTQPRLVIWYKVESSRPDRWPSARFKWDFRQDEIVITNRLVGEQIHVPMDAIWKYIVYE